MAFDGDRLLCVQLRPYKGAVIGSKGYWCLPGGKLEADEGLQAGLAREMLEETGVSADVGNLLYIQQFLYEGMDFLEFFFHIRNGADYRSIDLAATSHGRIELAMIDFIDPHRDDLLPRFLATEDIVAHAERGGAPRIFSYVNEA